MSGEVGIGSVEPGHRAISNVPSFAIDVDDLDRCHSFRREIEGEQRPCLERNGGVAELMLYRSSCGQVITLPVFRPNRDVIFAVAQGFSDSISNERVVPEQRSGNGERIWTRRG